MSFRDKQQWRIEARASGIFLFTNKTHISTTTKPMATKFGRVVTYHERLPPIKSHDPLTKWPFEITWQTKIILSLLPECLRPPNLVRLWNTLRSSSYLTLWSRVLYLHYQSVYGHQTWQDDTLPWWATTYKSTWPFDHVVLEDHSTN